MSIGTRIASVRGFRRMTQDQLGGLVGVTKQTVSGWEPVGGHVSNVMWQVEQGMLMLRAPLAA